MTTGPVNAATINQSIVCAPASADDRGSTPLTEAAIDHIAAAGSKPGTSGGAGGGEEPPRPPRPN